MHSVSCLPAQAHTDHPQLRNTEANEHEPLVAHYVKGSLSISQTELPDTRVPAQDFADGAAGAHDGRALLHGGSGVPAALDLHPRRGHHWRSVHTAGAQRLPMHASFCLCRKAVEGAARVVTLIRPSVQQARW